MEDCLDRYLAGEDDLFLKVMDQLPWSITHIVVRRGTISHREPYEIYH